MRQLGFLKPGLTGLALTCAALLTGCQAQVVTSQATQPAAANPALVPFDYTLKDAVYVYTCAYNKESDPAEKERLNNGLKILAVFKGKEAEYKASVDTDRINRHKVMNDLAVKYDCY